jgi:phage terminase small subunit
MGLRGAAPKPTKLRLLEGRSPGRDSGNRPVKPGPPFERGAPTPPDWISDEARDEWARVVPELEALGVLRLVDQAALVAYTETWSR